MNTYKRSELQNMLRITACTGRMNYEVRKALGVMLNLS